MSAVPISSPRRGKERSVRGAAAALALLLFGACGPRIGPSAPSPPPAPDGALRVTLTWAAPVDLDLYLTDPRAETLYFGNNPTRAGARLLRDAACASIGAAPPREEALVERPAAGTYRVGVDFIDTCGEAYETVPFQVAVDAGGARRTAAGVARPGRFTVVVLEFAVGEDGSLK